MCRIKKDLHGKVAVITGGNAGLGKETINELIKRGCRVIFGARSVDKNKEVVKMIRLKHKGALIESYKLDLSSKKSI